MEHFPFKIEIQPGSPAYEQVIHAVHRAIACGAMRAGDPFPSVRALSKSVRINPNTAHKVVQALIQEGTLEVIPGRGTRAAAFQERSTEDRAKLLAEPLTNLVIEAKRLGSSKAELKRLLDDSWQALTPNQEPDPQDD